MSPRPGRRRSPRWIGHMPHATLYKPAGIPGRELEVVVLSIEELESVRLSDLLGKTQDDAASDMGISRRSFWNDLMSARKKIAYALTHGCALEISGGNYQFSDQAGNGEEE